MHQAWSLLLIETVLAHLLFQLKVLWPVEAKSDDDKPDHDSKR